MKCLLVVCCVLFISGCGFNYDDLSEAREQGCQEIRSEAVVSGCAEWRINSKGVIYLHWLPIVEKSDADTRKADEETQEVKEDS